MEVRDENRLSGLGACLEAGIRMVWMASKIVSAMERRTIQ